MALIFVDFFYSFQLHLMGIVPTPISLCQLLPHYLPVSTKAIRTLSFARREVVYVIISVAISASFKFLFHCCYLFKSFKKVGASRTCPNLN
jgi:hypothetical protein